MHRITVVLHVPVDDDHLLIQLNNFHLLRLTNTENLDMEPFPVYCNRFVLLKVEEKFYKLIVIHTIIHTIYEFIKCNPNLFYLPWNQKNTMELQNQNHILQNIHNGKFQYKLLPTIQGTIVELDNVLVK